MSSSRRSLFMAPKAPTMLKWLPVLKTETYFTKSAQQFGCLENILRQDEALAKMFKIYEYSIPPFLDKRYHTMNVSEITKIDFYQHNQAVAAWFVCYCESFALQYLNDVQKKQYSIALQIIKQNDSEDNNLNLDGFNFWITRHGVLESSPTSADEASKPEEILLEPCVIIQLPWNTVLFHQWLIAALAQVYLFEKESLELRHWPLPVEIEPYARDFLFLVKQLKERVIFGFNILSKQVNIYPKVETQHPGWISDQVVLPSLATLQFLTSGKADEVLRSIKKTAWSKCELQEELEKRIYVPKDCYDYKMGEWADVYHNLYINCMYWSKGDSYGPFGYWCEDYETEGYEIKRDDVTKSSCDTAEDSTQRKASKFKEMSVDESGMYHVTNSRLGNVDKPSDIEARVKLILDVVRTVFQAKLLPAKKLKSCIKMFDCDLVRQNIGNHKKCKENLSQLQVAVIEHARLYNDMYVKLIGSETQKGVLSRVVNLQFEILEKEQLVRIAHYLGCFLNVTPMICHSEKSTSMEFKTATEIMKEVCDSQESHDRDWLWSQFSEEWRKPVERHEIDLDMTLPDLVEHFETRIGRLVVNTAQKCFEVFEKGGDIFQHWQMIQYIFPCYISLHVGLVQYSKNENNAIENSIKFLHHLFQYYEQLYESWHTNIIHREDKVETNAISHKETTEMYLALKDMKYNTNLIFRGSIGLINQYSFYYSLKNINYGLFGWIKYTSRVPENSEKMYYYIKSWLLKVTNIYKVICSICVDIFKVPIPGILFENKLLEKIYFMNAVLFALAYLCSKCFDFYKRDSICAENTSSALCLIKVYRKIIFKYQLELFFTVIHGCEQSNSISDVDLQEFRNLLNIIYCILKKHKQILPIVWTVVSVKDLPDYSIELTVPVLHFFNNEFEPLEKMLSIVSPVSLPSADDEELFKIFTDFLALDAKVKTQKIPPVASTSEPVPPKIPTVAVTKTLPSVPPKKCRNCPLTEEKRGTFLVCKKCKEQKYPDVNFYCSKSCKYAWWKTEHMAEHLEFELGLSDFSNLKLDDKPADTKGDKAGPSK